MRKAPNNRLRLKRNNTGFNSNLYQNVNKQGKLKSIIELNKMKYKRDNYKVDPKLLIKQSKLFQKKRKKPLRKVINMSTKKINTDLQIFEI